MTIHHGPTNSEAGAVPVTRPARDPKLPRVSRRLLRLLRKRRRRAERTARARLDVDARRAQLLELGIRIFGERPYDSIQIDEIARAAGISKGLLYHYWPSKREFYVAAVSEGARQLVEATLRGAATDAAPIERLRAALDAYLGWVEAHASAYGMLLRSGIGHDPQIGAIVEQTRARFLDRLIEEVGVPPAAVRLALRGWIGMVEGASLDWSGRRDVERASLRELLLDAFPPVVDAGWRRANL
jgi:AcrR family transcriptional regulator